MTTAPRVLFNFCLPVLFGTPVFARIDFTNRSATRAEYRANRELMHIFIPIGDHSPARRGPDDVILHLAELLLVHVIVRIPPGVTAAGKVLL